MQFLKTLFWVALAVVIVVFASKNWEPVSVSLWGGLRMDSKLPVLVIGAFVAGFLPLYLVYRAMLWRLRKRVASLEAQARPVEPVRPSAPLDPLDQQPGDIGDAPAIHDVRTGQRSL